MSFASVATSGLHVFFTIAIDSVCPTFPLCDHLVMHLFRYGACSDHFLVLVHLFTHLCASFEIVELQLLLVEVQRTKRGDETKIKC